MAGPVEGHSTEGNKGNQGKILRLLRRPLLISLLIDGIVRAEFAFFMSRRILAVDDDPDQLRAVCACLNDAGFVTSTARNGREALKKARSVSPDLIVLDLMMPQLDGFSVSVTLRKDADTASIPILMLTGFSSDFARRTGIEAGAGDYIVKPFNPEELVSKVEAMLCEHDAGVQNSPHGAALRGY